MAGVYILNNNVEAPEGKQLECPQFYISPIQKHQIQGLKKQTGEFFFMRKGERRKLNDLIENIYI